MLFLYSLKLFGSNFVKTLKFFLFYVAIWGLCAVLLLPVIFEFKTILSDGYGVISNSLTGVFSGSVGLRLSVLIDGVQQVVQDVYATNAGLAIYGLLVLGVLLPFLINIGKYALCEMLYSYMTSKNKIGFFSALVKSLRKSVPFAICRVIYNILFFVVTLFAFWGVAQVESEFFIANLLPLVECVLLVICFSIHQVTVLGWMPALIVFNCNVFSAYRKGFKAMRRHAWASFGTTILYFVIFWVLVFIFGIYTMVVLVPFLTSLLCVYNMVMFFSSQGMRFYVNSTNILTPKKLEEVDNINKTAFIL